MIKHILRGDTVAIIAGKHRGAGSVTTGKVVAVMPEADRVIVEGVNMVKRHTKAGKGGMMQGGIIEKASPIHVSNVALLDKKGNPTRVRVEVREDGSKVRIAVTTGDEIPKPKHN